jgi:GNAT superfamily N-acetyltransferase
VWRIAEAADDDFVVDMCLRLYTEDPGPTPLAAQNMRSTLAMLRRDPSRGRAVVLDLEGRASGYALLIRLWSNGLGGDVCEVDELFVLPEYRNRGYGTALFEAIARGDLWPSPTAAVALGVTPDNSAARRLYERLGFVAAGITMLHPLPQAPGDGTDCPSVTGDPG